MVALQPSGVISSCELSSGPVLLKPSSLRGFSHLLCSWVHGGVDLNVLPTELFIVLAAEMKLGSCSPAELRGASSSISDTSSLEATVEDKAGIAVWEAVLVSVPPILTKSCLSPLGIISTEVQSLLKDKLQCFVTFFEYVTVER